MEFEFAPELDAVDAVPEEFRPLYEQDPTSKKFKLGEKYGGVAKAVLGLNKALGAERKTKKVDLTPLAEFGKDPVEIKTAIQTKLDELTTQLAEKGNVNVKKLKEEFAQQHAQELQQEKTRSTALQGQLYKLLVELEATSKIVDAKGIPELVLPFLKNSVKVVEEDGEATVHVVDTDGSRRFSPVTGLPMSLKELVAELKANPKYGRLFESEAASGGGMPPKGGNRAPVRATGDLSANQKIAAGLAKGLKRGT